MVFYNPIEAREQHQLHLLTFPSNLAESVLVPHDNLSPTPLRPMKELFFLVHISFLSFHRPIPEE